MQTSFEYHKLLLLPLLQIKVLNWVACVCLSINKIIQNLLHGFDEIKTKDRTRFKKELINFREIRTLISEFSCYM